MVKNPPARQEDMSSILGSVRSSGEERGNSLQYPMDTRAWWATAHGVTEELDLT